MPIRRYFKNVVTLFKIKTEIVTLERRREELKMQIEHLERKTDV